MFARFDSCGYWLTVFFGQCIDSNSKSFDAGRKLPRLIYCHPVVSLVSSGVTKLGKQALWNDKSIKCSYKFIIDETCWYVVIFLINCAHGVACQRCVTCNTQRLYWPTWVTFADRPWSLSFSSGWSYPASALTYTAVSARFQFNPVSAGESIRGCCADCASVSLFWQCHDN